MFYIGRLEFTFPFSTVLIVNCFQVISDQFKLVYEFRKHTSKIIRFWGPDVEVQKKSEWEAELHTSLPYLINEFTYKFYRWFWRVLFVKQFSRYTFQFSSKFCNVKF